MVGIWLAAKFGKPILPSMMKEKKVSFIGGNEHPAKSSGSGEVNVIAGSNADNCPTKDNVVTRRKETAQGVTRDVLIKINEAHNSGRTRFHI